MSLAPVYETVYETHSATTDDEAGTATGRGPGELSPPGREQAREPGVRRDGEHFDAIPISAPAFPGGRDGSVP